MITIKNKLIPFGNYQAINLFGIIFTKKELNEKSKNHERIHTYQLIEMTIVGLYLMGALVIQFNLSYWWLLLGLAIYYIWNGIEYLIIRKFHQKQNDAYHDIAFEEEAYNNDDDLNYIQKRIPFNWVKYLKKKSFKK